MTTIFRKVLPVLLLVALLMPGVSAAGSPLTPQAQAAGGISIAPLSISAQVQPGNNSPLAPNSPVWYDGSISYSTVTNCISIIQGFPYQENGAGVYVGFQADPTAGQPASNTTYYVHVFIAGLGNACGGMRAYLDVALPASTSLAIDSGHPVYCFLDGAAISPPTDCPQSLPASSYNPGAYAIWSTDAAHAYTWPVPQGHNLEFQIPVKSSSVLTNSTLQANVWMLDGNSSPWLRPQQGVYVFSSQPTIVYPSPSTTLITATSAYSQVYLYTNGATGTGYFDLGTTIGYGVHDAAPIPTVGTAWLVHDDWGPTPLTPDTLYHWRFTFNNGVQTFYGIDQTFRTLPDGRVTVGSGSAAGCTGSTLDAALITPAVKQVVFDCGPAPVTITLLGTYNVPAYPFSVDGANNVTLQAAAGVPLFVVPASGQMTLSNITLTGGQNPAGCGGAISVANAATANLIGVHLTGNSASSGGGVCVAAGGSLILTNTQVSANSATGNGGGIWNAGSGDFMWSDVSGNTSGGNGGGAYNSGVLSFTASLISGNTALIGVTRAGTPTQGGGGGIFNSATLTITDSTVANNLSSFGGGVFNSEGKVTITSATIANNTAQAGGKGTLVKDAQAGGLESISSGAIGFANLRNTLIAGNVTIDPRILPANCGTSPQQTIQSLGHNFDSAGQCGFLDVSDMSDRDPLIGPLANNGGKTRSVALMPNSPAIDAGDNNVCGMYDQRGLSGPSGPGGILQRQVTGIGSGPAVCDIGAFEYHPAIFLPLVRR